MNSINLNNYEAFLLDYVEGNLSASHQAELLLFIEQHPELELDLDGFQDATLAPEVNQFPNKSHLKKINQADLEIFNQLAVLVLDKEADQSALSQFELMMKKYPSLANEFQILTKLILNRDDKSFFEHKSNLHAIPEQQRVFENLALKELEGLNTKVETEELESIIYSSVFYKKLFEIYEHTKIQPDLSISFEFKEQLKKGKTVYFPFNSRILKYTAGIAASIAILFGAFNILVQDKKNIVAVNVYDRFNAPLFSKKINASVPDVKAIEAIYISQTKAPSSKVVEKTPLSNNEVVFDDLKPILPNLSNNFTNNYADMLIDQVSPVDMNIVMYPGDGLIENAEDKDFLSLRNLALKRLNRAAGIEENMNWNAEDIAKGIEQVTNGNIKFKTEKEEKRQHFGFTIGNFSYQRSKAR